MAIHLVIHGRVQGVFYRDWTVETARSLRLTGWVRNLPEGTVEAHLEGDHDAVRTMVARMRDGPQRASVSRIDESPAEPENLSDFERR